MSSDLMAYLCKPRWSRCDILFCWLCYDARVPALATGIEAIVISIVPYLYLNKYKYKTINHCHWCMQSGFAVQPVCGSMLPVISNQVLATGTEGCKTCSSIVVQSIDITSLFRNVVFSYNCG